MGRLDGGRSYDRSSRGHKWDCSFAQPEQSKDVHLICLFELLGRNVYNFLDIVLLPRDCGQYIQPAKFLVCPSNQFFAESLALQIPWIAMAFLPSASISAMTSFASFSSLGK
jgi:hypothetical protein